MFWRAVRSVALVGLATLVVETLPDVARYLWKRDPQPRQP